MKIKTFVIVIVSVLCFFVSNSFAKLTTFNDNGISFSYPDCLSYKDQTAIGWTDQVTLVDLKRDIAVILIKVDNPDVSTVSAAYDVMLGSLMNTYAQEGVSFRLDDKPINKTILKKNVPGKLAHITATNGAVYELRLFMFKHNGSILGIVCQYPVVFKHDGLAIMDVVTKSFKVQ